MHSGLNNTAGDQSRVPCQPMDIGAPIEIYIEIYRDRGSFRRSCKNMRSHHRFTLAKARKKQMISTGCNQHFFVAPYPNTTGRVHQVVPTLEKGVGLEIAGDKHLLQVPTSTCDGPLEAQVRFWDVRCARWLMWCDSDVKRTTYEF